MTSEVVFSQSPIKNPEYFKLSSDKDSSMKALYLQNGVLEFKECPKPTPVKGQALLKVKMAGICNTDTELVKGYMGFSGILGHEFVGIVTESENKTWLGKRVCSEINFGCGQCEFCLKGLSRHCPNRSVLGILNQNGAFAEYVLAPQENLRFVPDTVADSEAVFVEPLAAAFEILEQVKIEPNHKVAVIGDGKLGLLIVQVLKLTGCDLTLIGKHDNKLKLAEGWNIKTVKTENNTGTKFDVVVEASGAAKGFTTALQLLKPRGTLILKSTYAGNLDINAAPIVIDEITVVGSRCGRFEPALRALEQKLVEVRSLIAAIYPFDRALEAFAKAKEPGTLKILLEYHD